jgi:16S rRNA (adenine1518-N6/adenine1519-N6)-dimethyltransferase
MELTSAALVKEAKAFHLKKRLGQHFLVDLLVLQQITTSLSATAGDTIVEIGPGIGFLTRLLSATAARIVAIDLDRESIQSLAEMKLPNVELQQGDFLQFDLSSVSPGDSRFKVVGNVPYQITGLILGHILGEIDAPSPWLQRIDSIVLTVQKEVAQRMVARPGSDAYSKVSLLISYYCDSELTLVIPPEAFYPPPKVTSAIVKLTPWQQPPVTPRNLRLFKQLIDAGFRQRRKMLRNALTFLHMPQEDIDRIFKQLSFDPQVRAERLGLPQFAMLADAIDEHLKLK